MQACSLSQRTQGTQRTRLAHLHPGTPSSARVCTNTVHGVLPRGGGSTTPNVQICFQISVAMLILPPLPLPPHTPPACGPRGLGEEMEVDEEAEVRKETAGGGPRQQRPKGPSQLKPVHGILSEQLTDPDAEHIRKGVLALLDQAGPARASLQPLAENLLAAALAAMAERRSNQHKLDAQHLERAANKDGPSELLKQLAILAKPSETGAQPAGSQPASLLQGALATLGPFMTGQGVGEDKLLAAVSAAAQVKYEESPTKTARNLHFRVQALRSALKQAISDSAQAHSVSGGPSAAKQAAEAVDKLAEALLAAIEQQHQFASLANMLGDQEAASAMQRTAVGMRGYTPAVLNMLSALASDADLRSMMRSVLRVGDSREGKRTRSPSPNTRDRSDSGHRGGGGGWFKQRKFQRSGGGNAGPSGSGSGKDAKGSNTKPSPR